MFVYVGNPVIKFWQRCKMDGCDLAGMGFTGFIVIKMDICDLWG